MKYANIVMTVEIMVQVPNDTDYDTNLDWTEVKIQLAKAVKNGNWYNVTGPKIVHLVSEENKLSTEV